MKPSRTAAPKTPTHTPKKEPIMTAKAKVRQLPPFMRPHKIVVVHYLDFENGFSEITQTPFAGYDFADSNTFVQFVPPDNYAFLCAWQGGCNNGTLIYSFAANNPMFEVDLSITSVSSWETVFPIPYPNMFPRNAIFDVYCLCISTLNGGQTQPTTHFIEVRSYIPGQGITAVQSSVDTSGASALSPVCITDPLLTPYNVYVPEPQRIGKDLLLDYVYQATDWLIRDNGNWSTTSDEPLKFTQPSSQLAIRRYTLVETKTFIQATP